ncbi:ABC transporter permease [Mucilaginibacter pocheonensis]|uniref:ABC-type antimicrobial peptide transport system permease subunit/AraC-like DNA-binding protein n=1 Tax=Mucilaginibacter pocheonensis TaxID=398050 RepID=A0ABU1T508_9SPHI|nr:ABC transporter permease [Mucilaginibacter pocheonensis]MDR6940331.1 ABC-type antimicrobial peptide transport system permease subunit/AraC-like DNA-binding protein [Mucilaginibacter pocheonensis]
MNTYTLHINTYDVAFVGAIFIGLTFILLLWFTKKINRAANRFLALAMVTIVLWIARILGTDIGLSTYITNWSRLPLQFSLALGPLIFFYVLKITRPEYKFRYKDLLHFSPLLLELGAQALEIRDSIKTGAATYETPAFRQLNPVLQLLAFVSVIIYLCLAHRLTGRFYRELKFNGGDRHRYELRWLRSLLKSFGVVWLLWVPLTAADYFYYNHQLSIHAYYPLYLLLAIITIWMAAVAFLRPEAGELAETPSFLKPPLPSATKERGIWLKKAVQANRYYQDPELSLSSLAEKLGLGPHELSRIINTVLKKSFNDFINEYRVQAVTRKMQDPAYDHITLLGIAFESGFNSQSTFNRIFRQMTGKSPLEYKNDLKKEYPSYNLGSHSQFAPVILNRETPPKWSHENLSRNYMFKNYFKIARRNLLRNKSYTIINVTGLAVGIAVCMVIFIIIQYQTSFDKFHLKKDRTYRVLTEYHHADAGTVSYGKSVPFPMATGLRTAFPQLEQVAPIYASHNDQLQVLDANGTPVKNFKEPSGVFYTSPSFFNIFDFPLVAGSYESLKDPNNVLLTKEIADKYFGDWKAAMGKTIKLTGSYSIGAGLFQSPPVALKVSGILATIPANTDFQLKLVIAYGTDFTGDNVYGFQQPNWNETSADLGCYVLLPPNISADKFNQQLRAYSRKVLPANNKDSHIIQPLSAVHYDAAVGNYSNRTISRELLNVLWLIAAFILLIACVNFINLSTAQAVNRAKEVGVRKVLGSNKFQLRVQFIVETFLIVTSAVLLAAGITTLGLPYINQLLELSLSFNILNPSIILFLLIVTIVVTALAGFYPSIVLSRFNPVNALKSKLTVNNANGISLRRGLVVFQFIIAQVLIIGTLIIVKQMDYFMSQPLGFDKEAIVNVPFRPDSTGSRLANYLRQQLLQVNGVQAVSFSSNTPVEDDNNRFTTLKFDNAIKEADFQAIVKFADNNYVPTYKLQLVAGRNLQPSDLTREFLVNESFVKSLGLKKPEDILNKEVTIWGDVIKCPVVGVLKDFNDRSLRNNLEPLLIATNITMYRQAAIKLTTINITSAMPSIKNIFVKTFPDFVYDYQFLDDKIANFYKQENQLSQLYKIFAAIAIFLSCLGLYGLASFMAVQRVKEVGIRKVLGASAGSIVYLFSKEFVMLITIAFAIATPVAWYYMHQWLQAYAYRISISWGLMAAGGLIAIIIALATISFQAIKAAKANPVKSLRNE